MIELSVITKIEFKDEKKLQAHIDYLLTTGDRWFGREIQAALDSPNRTKKIETDLVDQGCITVSEIKIMNIIR